MTPAFGGPWSKSPSLPPPPMVQSLFFGKHVCVNALPGEQVCMHVRDSYPSLWYPRPGQQMVDIYTFWCCHPYLQWRQRRRPFVGSCCCSRHHPAPSLVSFYNSFMLHQWTGHPGPIKWHNGSSGSPEPGGKHPHGPDFPDGVEPLAGCGPWQVLYLMESP